MRREIFPGWEGGGQRQVKAALLTAIALCSAYAVVECGSALAIGSVALAANAIGHFEGASVQLLLLLALDVGRQRRARLALILSTPLLLLVAIALWQVWHGLVAPVPPSPTWLGVLGAAALVVDLVSAAAAAQASCAKRWAAFRSLLWPRAVTGPLIVLAAYSSGNTGSAWPDLTIGLGIMVANIGAAKAVYRAGAVVRSYPQSIRSPDWWMRKRADPSNAPSASFPPKRLPGDRDRWR